MSWQERIGPAEWTSPSGEVFPFQFEDVSETFRNKTTVFDFAGGQGTYVQHKGSTLRRIPVRVIFSGDNYDIIATRFQEACREVGISTLLHPMYGPGPRKVVPFGDVPRVDKLKTGGNEATFDMMFFETTELLFPRSNETAADAVRRAIEGFNEEGPGAFDDETELDTPVEEQSFKDQFKAGIATAKSGLADIAAFEAAIEREFNFVIDAANSAVDTLIGGPLSLAFQFQKIAQLPAQTFALLSDKLKAYGGLMGQIFLGNGGASGTTNVYEPGNDNQNINAFHSDDLFAGNYLIAATISSLEAEFSTRTEAIGAADALMALCDTLQAWRDENLVSLSAVDTGEVYQQVSAACATAAGFLVQASFQLKQERSIVLQRPRTPLDLEAELYGTADENLDLLISSNDLGGSAIFEIPRYTRIVYYQ